MAEEKTKTEETNQNLIDFDWDEDIEFFGVKTETEDVTGIEEKKSEKKEEKEEPKKKEKEEVEEKEDKKEKEEKEEEFFKKTETDEPENDEFFSTLAGELKEQGVFQNVEIPEDEEITQEKFIELQDAEVNARVEEALDSFMDELDEDGKAFLKFKKEGGNTKDFFNVVAEKSTIPKGDIDDIKYQKKILEYYYSTYDGMDEDEISDRLDWLEDSNKLKKFAEKYEDKLQEKVKQKENAIIAQQEKLKKQQEEEDKKFVNTIKTKLEKTDKIKDFPITKRDKSELVNYITKPSVKVGKNKFLTKFQADMQQVTSDYEKLILLAKIVKNDFDISDIEKEVTTKKTKDLREKLERQKQNPKIKSSGSSTKKSLSDYF